MPINVQVSSAVADQYFVQNGHELDAKALQEMVGEHLRRAVEAGSVELSAEEGAETSLVLNLEQKVADPTRLHTEGCTVYLGVVSFSSNLIINDKFGCRRYVLVDNYDHFYNQCVGGESYVYCCSSTLGPYSC